MSAINFPIVGKHKPNQCAILDLQNLLKTIHLDDKTLAGPNFKSLEEIRINFIEVINRINNYGIDNNKIYLIFKSFNFIDQITKKNYGYHDLAKYIIWIAHKYFSNWEHPRIILVDSLDRNDKEVDDRALFVLYKALAELNESPIIFSNDNFRSLLTDTAPNKRIKYTYYKLIDFHNDWTRSQMVVDKIMNGMVTDGLYDLIHPYENHNAAHKIVKISNMNSF